MVVRVIDPTQPTYKQVQAIQDTINNKLSGQFQGLELQMQVQRINVTVVEGNEVNERVDLEQIFNEADAGLAPVQVLEDKDKDKDKDEVEVEVEVEVEDQDEDELEVEAVDSIEPEICTEPDC